MRFIVVTLLVLLVSSPFYYDWSTPEWGLPYRKCTKSVTTLVPVFNGVTVTMIPTTSCIKYTKEQYIRNNYERKVYPYTGQGIK